MPLLPSQNQPLLLKEKFRNCSENPTIIRKRHVISTIRLSVDRSSFLSCLLFSRPYLYPEMLELWQIITVLLQHFVDHIFNLSQ